MKRRDFVGLTGLATGALFLPGFPSFGGTPVDPLRLLEPGLDVAQKKRLADVALNAAKSAGASYADVRIGRVAVAQGNLTLRVEEAPLVSQPNPFAEGQTVVVPRSQVGIEESPGGLAELTGGTSLSEVIAGLNALGVETENRPP